MDRRWQEPSEDLDRGERRPRQGRQMEAAGAGPEVLACSEGCVYTSCGCSTHGPCPAPHEPALPSQWSLGGRPSPPGTRVAQWASVCWIPPWSEAWQTHSGLSQVLAQELLKVTDTNRLSRGHAWPQAAQSPQHGSSGRLCPKERRGGKGHKVSASGHLAPVSLTDKLSGDEHSGGEVAVAAQEPPSSASLPGSCRPLSRLAVEMDFQKLHEAGSLGGKKKQTPRSLFCVVRAA